MKTKKLLVLFVVLLSLVLLTMFFLYIIIRDNTLGERDLPEILKEKTLNVVTEYNSVDYYVSEDSITGLQYELCKYIGKRSGLTVQIFLENNLELSMKGLENKTYDVIARNIPITNENKQLLAFTIPITQSKQVLVQRKKLENDSVFIDNQIKLAHKTIYVSQNSPAILRLKNLSEEIAEEIMIKEITDYSSEQLIYMVNQKEIDYAVVDKEIALKNTKQFPDLDFEMDISFTQLQAWALRKTSPVLLDSLNVWIADYKKNRK
ncbi:glutamine ABC transporter substrate-binding protein [Bacteroidia bacterium]|nr:glutamine ABC transporter substrate-binding protein [Bacteroidia bacterium]GHU83347.1 glutamine ABC transporter substrate-binding protein [Bacteroidia bacterium]